MAELAAAVDAQLGALHTARQGLEGALGALRCGPLAGRRVLAPVGRVAFIPREVTSDAVLCQISSEYLAELTADECARRLRSRLRTVEEQIRQFEDVYYNKDFMDRDEIESYERRMKEFLDGASKPVFLDGGCVAGQPPASQRRHPGAAIRRVSKFGLENSSAFK